MNDTVAEQQNIFDIPLDSKERETLDALVGRHKANAAFTQQLALDASKLVATSQERLAAQSGAGFFKRLAGAISGKTGENQAMNQADLLHMQKFAWHYLKQLQQQNLINAQSIAVIRNHLGTMNDYVIETRDFLEQAVDRIDQRLRNVENNVSFNNWALNIESNKRRLKSNPRILLILRLVYDFQRAHRDVPLTGRDVANYLVTTLEKLDIDCDEEIRLLDFIGELIDQIDVVGLDQYRALIELSFDEHVVDGDFIQKNISGLGFNALYFLADQYERIVDLTGDEELCNNDAAREKIIAKFFGKEFSGLATTYSLRDLVCELIGGSQVAIEVYKEVHGLNAVPEPAAATAQKPAAQEPVALVSALPDITAHTFLDQAVGDAAKRDYLLLFALCVDRAESLNKPAREFLALLAERAGMRGCEEKVVGLADDPRKFHEYQAALQALLDDDDKKYTWLFDAFFLLALAGISIENPKIMAILGVIKPVRLKESLPDMVTIVEGSDEDRILEAAHKLSAITQAWKNVVRYRMLSFERHFGDTVKRLNSASWSATRLLLESSMVFTKGMEHAFYFGYSDGGLLGNLGEKAGAALCGQGRKSAMASLNALRKSVVDFLSEHRSALYQANSVMTRWNMPSLECKSEVGHSPVDLDNGADNEEWGDQFQHYYRQVDEALNAFSDGCNEAAEQIGLFIAGNFDRSIVAVKAKKLEETRQQQERERLAKRSVTIVKDGREHLFGIEWQKLENPPCKPEDILHIKTDGKIWVIVANVNSDEVFYRSADLLHWQQLAIDTPGMTIFFRGIDVVNGMWIIRNGELRNGTRPEGFYYSSDALAWRHSRLPASSGLSPAAVLYSNGLWLWHCTQYENYRYTEKGFFSDTAKTGSYARTIVLCTPSLDEPWRNWEWTPKPAEGVEIEAIHALPGVDGLVAFCKYDYSYVRDKKKPETPPFVLYFGASRTWQDCNWSDSSGFRSNPIFARIGARLMAFAWGETRVSDKGYDWQSHAMRLYAEECFALPALHLFTSRGSSTVQVTQDGATFKEIELDAGHWSHVTANDDGMLAVYYLNKHEETVLQVGRYLCSAAS